jgi:3-deoxy-D-manno-octulosonate 8-phosphate phosphatase (KDO 8-P phosphatase)
MDTEVRARRVKLLIFDVDGVLTSGQLLFGPDGEALKVFHAHDGLGISTAHRAGLKTAVITGRESEMVRRRGSELSITDICQGAKDKVIHLTELLDKHNLTADEVAYTGDDLNDLAVMARVGLAFAVANAAPEVKAAAHHVTVRPGGDGAVREVVELILKAQGKWAAVVESFRGPGGETRQ